VVTEKPSPVFQNYLAMLKVGVHFNVFKLVKEAQQETCHGLEMSFYIERGNFAHRVTLGKTNITVGKIFRSELFG